MYTSCVKKYPAIQGRHPWGLAAAFQNKQDKQHTSLLCCVKRALNNNT